MQPAEEARTDKGLLAYSAQGIKRQMMDRHEIRFAVFLFFDTDIEPDIPLFNAYVGIDHAGELRSAFQFNGESVLYVTKSRFDQEDSDGR